MTSKNYSSYLEVCNTVVNYAYVVQRDQFYSRILRICVYLAGRLKIVNTFFKQHKLFLGYDQSKMQRMPYFIKSNTKFKALKFWCADESWSCLVPLHMYQVLSQVNGLMSKFKITPNVVFHPAWTRLTVFSEVTL